MLTQHDGPSRRQFLKATGVSVVGGSLASTAVHASPRSLEPNAVMTGSSRRVQDGSITTETLAEAEKLAGVSFTEAERATMLPGVSRQAAGFQARREFFPDNALSPAASFDPRLPGVEYPVDVSGLKRPEVSPPELPRDEVDIAFSPVDHLSRWIQGGQLTSERLTGIYLDRLKRHGPALECVVTLTEDLAMSQARRADAEIAQGRYRGPLHGIPWGAKDLLDTQGIRTSWGAMPYRDRVPHTDAAVVTLLAEAGAVLVAKLTLGALAYGDIWFGGKTRNPFNPEQGSSGSSAGSASATAAGLVGFSLGTETLGSIVSPSMRCGATGLRPTFGRVPRTGAMALCWSLDKIGPICRTAMDSALVLDAINGYDAGDAGSVDVPFAFDGTQPIDGLRVGYDPSWFEGRGANDIDRKALDALRNLPVELVEVRLPDLRYQTLRTILYAEAATAFEEITLNNTDDTMVWQEQQAWPNSFREARFIPAIELLQADRFRRHVMKEFHGVWEGHELDAMFGPSYADSMLLITNNTGHPSLTIRAGFYQNGSPHGVTFWGRLFDEATVLNLGRALENTLDVWRIRPKQFN